MAGQPISQALFNYYLTQKAGVASDKVDATHKASLLDELKRLKAAAVIGEAQAESETTQALELQRIELLAHAAAKAAGVYVRPTEEDLQAEYRRFKAGLPAQEFHAAHILVATEAPANVLILKLQSGTDFAKLAREQSADDSKTRGGDLGWIAAGTLPVEFTDALRVLKPGQFTTKPVHTTYGWHIIRLIETRAAPAPPFEQVEAQLATNLEQSRYRQFLDSTVAKAKVTDGH